MRSALRQGKGLIQRDFGIVVAGICVVILFKQ